MANHKSAKKATRQAIKRTARNKSRMARVRTFVKQVETLTVDGLTAGAVSKEDALSALRKAESELMRGVTKGVIKKNTAARKVSRLAKRVKTLSLASS